MDGEIKRERALQNWDEEDEEWVWSGQMCSNVFWPDLCKDKNMSTDTVSQPTYLLSTPLCYSGGRKQRLISFLLLYFLSLLYTSVVIFSLSTTLKKMSPFHSASHDHVCKHAWIHKHIHTQIPCLHGRKPNVSSNRPMHPLPLILANHTIRELMTHLSTWLADGCAWVCVRACARVCASVRNALTSPQTHLASDNFLLLPPTTNIFRERHGANASPWTT